MNELHVLAATGNDAGLARAVAAAAEAGEDLDVNALDAVGRSPLIYAVVSKSAAAVQVLLDAGASCLTQDVDGRLPLHWAAFHGKVKVVKMLLARSDHQGEAVDKEGRTALHWATVQDSKNSKVGSRPAL